MLIKRLGKALEPGPWCPTPGLQVLQSSPPAVVWGHFHMLQAMGGSSEINKHGSEAVLPENAAGRKWE